MQKLHGISMSKKLNKKNQELASDLSGIRKRIDNIDHQIQTLINDRGEYVPYKMCGYVDKKALHLKMLNG